MTEHIVTERTHEIHEHQFEDRLQQKEAATLGMWTFLATEVLFFGGLFVSYTIYRHRWPNDFRQGSLDLKWYMGGVNTAVLLVSSFTMAMAVHAASIGSNRGIIRYLVLTILIGTVFLCIKGCEYYIEYEEHLVPGLNFAEYKPRPREMSTVAREFDKFDDWFNEHVSPPRQKSDQRTPGQELFFLFYFIMTGIHATHMIIGICVMLVLIWMAKREMFSAKWHNPVENFGLYWHFVDIVWVFLFPSLYLLRNP